jgi:hypothetical protein
MKDSSLNRFWVSAVVLTVVLGWGTMAWAGAFDGTWKGEVFIEGKSVPAELTIEHHSSIIRFMAPLNCQIELELPMADSDTNYMAGVDSCSGGYCDNVWNGRLKLQKSQEDAVNILIMDEHSAPWGQGTLNRQ